MNDPIVLLSMSMLWRTILNTAWLREGLTLPSMMYGRQLIYYSHETHSLYVFSALGRGAQRFEIHATVPNKINSVVLGSPLFNCIGKTFIIFTAVQDISGVPISSCRLESSLGCFNTNDKMHSCGLKWRSFSGGDISKVSTYSPGISMRKIFSPAFLDP